VVGVRGLARTRFINTGKAAYQWYVESSVYNCNENGTSAKEVLPKLLVLAFVWDVAAGCRMFAGALS